MWQALPKRYASIAATPCWQLLLELHQSVHNPQTDVLHSGYARPQHQQQEQEQQQLQPESTDGEVQRAATPSARAYAYYRLSCSVSFVRADQPKLVSSAGSMLGYRSQCSGQAVIVAIAERLEQSVALEQESSRLVQNTRQSVLVMLFAHTLCAANIVCNLLLNAGTHVCHAVE